MKRLGWLFLISGISIICFYIIYIKILENKTWVDANNYINKTSIIRETIKETKRKDEEKNK